MRVHRRRLHEQRYHENLGGRQLLRWLRLRPALSIPGILVSGRTTAAACKATARPTATRASPRPASPPLAPRRWTMSKSRPPCLRRSSCFCTALQSLSREIQALGEDRLHSLLQSLTRNRWSGFLLGAGFTAVVQSSSAVTALAVVLVDSGAISFANSLAVLIGSNVGTTATAWLVSFRLTGIGPAFIVLSALIGILPGPLRVVGKSVFYFGFVFFVLDLLSDALSPLANDPAFASLLASVRTPLLGALAGALLTALVQSSSVTTGIAILLVSQGALDVSAAVAIVVGANVGSTVTSLIASIPMRAAAKRTALANLLINAVGFVLVVPLVRRWTSTQPATMHSSPGWHSCLAYPSMPADVTTRLLCWLMPYSLRRILRRGDCYA